MSTSLCLFRIDFEDGEMELQLDLKFPGWIFVNGDDEGDLHTMVVPALQ
jgi:hypothetical protein